MDCPKNIYEKDLSAKYNNIIWCMPIIKTYCELWTYAIHSLLPPVNLHGIFLTKQVPPSMTDTLDNNEAFILLIRGSSNEDL